MTPFALDVAARPLFSARLIFSSTEGRSTHPLSLHKDTEWLGRRVREQLINLNVSSFNYIQQHWWTTLELDAFAERPALSVPVPHPGLLFLPVKVTRTMNNPPGNILSLWSLVSLPRHTFHLFSPFLFRRTCSSDSSVG